MARKTTRIYASPQGAPSEPWESDPRGQAAVDFINNLTHIGDYSRQPFRLQPWQERPIRRLFGHRNLDGSRVIKVLHWILPRKNGKTELAAALGLCLLFLGPDGQEIYAGASDEDKASRSYKAMAQMIRQDRHLKKRVQLVDSELTIRYPATSSVFRALASDSDQGHSLSPSALILDELHLWKSFELYNALTSGFGARKDRLEIRISTAGKRREGLFWDLHSDARKVRDGIVDDPELLPVIYEADDDDDWTDEKVWRKAMPALGTFCSLDFIRSEFRKARRIKWREHAFRQLYLNQWVEDADESWIPHRAWRECVADPYGPEDLAGEACYAALDLSSVRDLTALALWFPAYSLALAWCWLPSKGLADREERDKVPYRAWAADPAVRLKLTRGDRIVYADVARDVNEVLARFEVARFVADPYNLRLIAEDLDAEPETYQQTPGMMSPPAKWFEAAVFDKAIGHDGNPLLSWCVGNMVVEKDKYENIRPCKRKSRRRIDPAVALIMALGAWLGSRSEGTTPAEFYGDKSNMIF